MKNYTVEGFDRAKSEMLSDFNKAISDAAALREAAVEVSGDGSSAARTSVEEKLGSAEARPADASLAAAGTAAETTTAADLPGPVTATTRIAHRR